MFDVTFQVVMSVIHIVEYLWKYCQMSISLISFPKDIIAKTSESLKFMSTKLYVN